MHSTVVMHDIYLGVYMIVSGFRIETRNVAIVVTLGALYKQS
jgi:hypothetical protein